MITEEKLALIKAMTVASGLAGSMVKRGVFTFEEWDAIDDQLQVVLNKLLEQTEAVKFTKEFRQTEVRKTIINNDLN